MITEILIKLLLFFFTLINFVLPFNLEQEVVFFGKESVNEYKAITYNIHRGTNKFGFPSLNQISDLLKKENPDFLALQEVDRYNIRSGFKDQIKTLSDQLKMEYVFGPNMNFMVTEYGNAIMSKYPIIESGQIELARETEPRSLLWAKVKTDDGYLYLTSIHLGLDTKLRSEHFAIIGDFINSLDEPVLLMGDLNVLPDNQLFAQFRLKISGQIYYQEIPTYINNKPIQIDYIIGRKIKEIQMYNIPSHASDHYPLVLTFKIGSYPINQMSVVNTEVGSQKSEVITEVRREK